jgi:hypothetical protein
MPRQRRAFAGVGDRCTTRARIDRTPRHHWQKTITAPGDGLDAASLRSPLIENAAERCDLDGQVVVFDHRSRPDSGNDFVLQDEVAVPLDQYTEHIERARADRDRNENTAGITPAQAAPVEAKVVELKNVAGGARLHAPSPRGGERGRR